MSIIKEFNKGRREREHQLLCHPDGEECSDGCDYPPLACECKRPLLSVDIMTSLSICDICGRAVKTIRVI